jgi:hypothetical protein
VPAPILAGLMAGLVFGVILVWHGAGAAGLVLLFTVVGWLIGVIGWLVWRIINGKLDTETLHNLASTILMGRRH